MSSSTARSHRSLASWLTVLLAALVFVTAQVEPVAAKPDPEQEKINTYVELLNKWAPIVFKQFDSYRDKIDLEAGPNCAALKTEPRLSRTSADVVKSLEKYVKATKAKPKLEVDAAVLRMVDAIIAQVEPSTEASEYYFQRTFEDDDCKRGKELHPVLVANWKQFIAAERELRAFIVAYNDKLAVESIAATKKKYGTKFRFHFEQLLLDGKALVREVDSQAAQARPDVAAVRARVETYAATLEAVETLYADAKGDKKLHEDLRRGGYELFLWRCKSVASSSKALVELLDKPASKNTQQQLERKYNEVFRVYNDMIGAANKTRFSNRVK